MLDVETATNLWKYSSEITGSNWPPANQPKSPCPTLKVVGAVTKMLNAKEEAKRMEPAPGMVAGMGGNVLAGTAKVADKVVGATVGKVAKIAQSRLLGQLPDQAVTGSFQEDKNKKKKMPRFERLRRGPFRRQKAAATEDELVAAIMEQVEAAPKDEDTEPASVKGVEEQLQVELLKRGLREEDGGVQRVPTSV